MSARYTRCEKYKRIDRLYIIDMIFKPADHIITLSKIHIHRHQVLTYLLIPYAILSTS